MKPALLLSLLLAALIAAGLVLLAQRAQPLDPHFEATSAEAAGVDASALELLRQRAIETRSDALLVLHDGRLLLDYRSGGLPGRLRDPRIETMSATKSILGLAVGLALADGAIASLDQPVADFFPQWREGPTAAVTVGQLLDHSSGLCADRTTEAIYASADFVQHALNSGLCAEPGEALFYNNSATNLLAGVVGTATGQSLSAYLAGRLFDPLEIKQFSWSQDRAGNPHGMSGLQISARDLARIGQTVLDDGRWRGQQLLPADWIEASFAASREPALGSLLWWPLHAWERRRFDAALFEAWASDGVAAEFIARLQPLAGQQFELPALRQRMAELLGEDWRDIVNAGLAPSEHGLGWRELGPVIGIEARGYLGQRLTILRDARIVGVRQIRYGSHRRNQDDDFADFSERLLALVRD